jgi:small subunit ribosomal protein S13
MEIGCYRGFVIVADCLYADREPQTNARTRKGPARAIGGKKKK